MAVDGDGHAMTIADYSAIGVLIVLATWAGVMLYLRGSYNGCARLGDPPRLVACKVGASKQCIGRNQQDHRAALFPYSG